MDEYERRRGLSFLQAEGEEPLPSQLAIGVVSPSLRAKIWNEVHNYLKLHSAASGRLMGAGNALFQDFHVNYQFGYADEYDSRGYQLTQRLKPAFTTERPTKILDATQWMLRHQHISPQFKARITAALVETRSAYRVVNGDTLMPIASEQDATTVVTAFKSLEPSRYDGARTHLAGASRELTSGNFAGSVRESAQAIESVARVIEPSGELSKALSALEAKQRMHGALKKGFLAIYGYTSDEKGIRHPLLEEGDAAVDETDALFMIGAASAFITYLIRKNTD